jgi:glycine oxidase
VEVIVVGSGPVGAACARELAVAGHRVLALDPGDRSGAAFRASAGLLAPQIDPREDHPLFEIGIAGREYYRDKSAELADESGIDIELFDGGILRLARGESEADRLRSAVAWQRQHGHRAEWLDPGEVRSEFKHVGPCDGALWASHDGSVNPVRLVEALRASAVRRGARFETGAATGLIIESGRLAGVRTEGARYPADQVVLAAGAWTGRLAGLPRPVSVEPVRGQMIVRPWPEGVPPAIVYGAGGYVLRRNGEAWCGATMEHAGFATEVTDAGRRHLTAIADTLLPALTDTPIVQALAGLRPGTPDGLPIFGAEPQVPGLWYATGYGRNGILFAGITAVALGHLLAGEATFEGVEAMGPARFWSW